MAKLYEGYRTADGCVVIVVDDSGRRRKLPLKLNLANHSPTGFEWGYAGSGPAQLALALLADVLKDDDRAMRLHQRFKHKHIATLDRGDHWVLSEVFIRNAIEELEANAVS